MCNAVIDPDNTTMVDTAVILHNPDSFMPPPFITLSDFGFFSPPPVNEVNDTEKKQVLPSEESSCLEKPTNSKPRVGFDALMSNN
jgi:hypothetical protein